MNRTLPSRVGSWFSHGTAALLALIYVWCISRTDLRQTGLQFVGPLLIIFFVQTATCLSAFGLSRNVYSAISRRTLTTSVILLFGVFLLTAVTPDTAHSVSEGSFGDTVSDITALLVCLLVIAISCAIVGFVLYSVFKGLKRVYRLYVPKTNESDKHNKTRELASILLTVVFLSGISLEGVKGAYSFDSAANSSASQLIRSSKENVWLSLETATQPEFSIPSILTIFPRPVEVIVDEGTALNANRIVKFEGREGIGQLHLRVTERTDDHVKFQVISDTSPIANWVKHETLTYRVESTDLGTLLSVELGYNRLLSPAWFFNSFIGGATHLAMDVLARDVKTRTEQDHNSV